MKLKSELKKFYISIFFITFYSFYYNSDQFRKSLLDGLDTTIFGLFRDYQTFLIGISLYLVGYIFFNLIYLCIYGILKLLKSQKNIIVVTTMVISITIFLKIINDQLIYSSLKDYEMIRYYSAINSGEVKIDSTNFHEFDWERKSIAQSYVSDRKIVFNEDSTFTLSVNTMTFDKFYLFRKLLNLKIEYEIKSTYEYGNLTTFISMEDSCIHCPLQIRNNRLYLNTSFYP